MKTLRKSREHAYHAQHGHCCYCGRPMLLDLSGIEAFRRRYRLSRNIAISLLTTAEHLQPRSEGGANGVGNIAAAHAVCNRRRHRSNRVLSPEAYRAHVQRHCARGGWHPLQVLRMPVPAMRDAT